MSTEVASSTIERVTDNVARVVHADRETLQLVVLCLVSGGHLIIEDFPGVGKTMLVKALARSLHVTFSRIQFTPDLLPSDIVAVADGAKRVLVEETINAYVVSLLQHTRDDPRLSLGASPRAGIALMRVAKARALASGRDFVSPDDVKRVAAPVLAHRLIVAPEAGSSGVAAAGGGRGARARTHDP